jgi:hypothetical protein
MYLPLSLRYMKTARTTSSWFSINDISVDTSNCRHTSLGGECRGSVNRSAIGVGVWRFVEGGEHGGAIRDGGSTSLPSFRSRNRYKCSITMMRLAISLCDWPCLSLGASRAPPRRLIKVHGVDITMVAERIQYGVLD